MERWWSWFDKRIFEECGVWSVEHGEERTRRNLYTFRRFSSIEILDSLLIITLISSKQLYMRMASFSMSRSSDWTIFGGELCSVSIYGVIGARSFWPLFKISWMYSRIHRLQEIGNAKNGHQNSRLPGILSALPHGSSKEIQLGDHVRPRPSMIHWKYSLACGQYVTK